ncbi:efflux RND transporter periplasmic adaptor subunit [Desulfotalea psychrophila]|uniref:Multidrug resistance protein MdtA-like barrel-sandwich hybrid domain-containing protein n=1 Tax=Desulfotalea psychrophila (strain LSv54 / DSM 12343) TaxID=177439 RepID=Q6AJB5_DESPS|nr:hypothetical protein [Desulfotalea psychrophila]CAG37565.1 hypothetical protein DP2836 [Desulfotalea psychrophila LSv54]
MSNPTNTFWTKTGNFLLPIAIIACAIAIAFWLIETKPEAQQKPQKKFSTIVEVQQVERGPEHIYIEARGVVGPSKRITITTQITGKILHLDPNFQPGGFLKKDAVMARIDPRDYQFILQQRQAELKSSRSELVLETGNQLVALKELELLGEPVSAEEKHLMLRGPQLKKLHNNLNSDQARYDQAKLNLARTKIRAPFNGTVDSLSSDIGSLVTNGTGLASFTGTDEFWIQLQYR